MQRKMIRFALAGKCEALGESGLVDVVPAEAVWLRPANARYPKPADADRNISRRERVGIEVFMIVSFN
jgi:hypothetical protein